jgi:hypothetical protein
VEGTFGVNEANMDFIIGVRIIWDASIQADILARAAASSAFAILGPYGLGKS